jgi:hypothetical protein
MRASTLAYYLILGVVFYVMACKSSTNRFPKTANEVQVEIPNDKGKEDFLYKFIVKNAFDLKLDSLQLGYDSLQLRFWLGHSMAMVRDLIILKLKDSKWTAYHISFTDREDGSVFKRRTRRVSPISGWEDFKIMINDLKIIELLDQTNVNSRSGCGGADGMIYYYEMGNAKKYRFFYNCHPDQRFIKFVTYLEKEFDFEYLKE